ncbi:leukemia-associated protein 7 [Bombina bombina]|uniref:leukemia-associated protein 7 n=1 Tax=Bombina bombina TaxID=8345 RepID=UPI00235A7065|nr:leukemia-associated protein 7 [Bombina bombina]
MHGPALLGASISHQDVAFQTLRLLLQQRGLNNETSSKEGPLHNGLELHTQDSHDTGDSPNTRSCESSRDVIPSSGTRLNYLCPTLKTDCNPQRGTGSASSSKKRYTLAEIASRNRLCRVVNATAEILVVEQNLLNNLPMENTFIIQLKDSIEFRNICTHMALQVEGRQFDQDVIAAQQCLRTIVTNLIQSLSVYPHHFHEAASADLNHILQKISEN